MATGTTKRSHARFVRNAKLSSHESIPYHVSGMALTLATSTSLQNCHDRRETILVALAPSTFLMPISLSFSVVVNDASPHSPRHAIKMASTAKKLKIRSEEHTSELQSRENLVCRLLLEKKKKKILNSTA